MTEQQQPLGVQTVWDGSAVEDGTKRYIQNLEAAARATQKFADATMKQAAAADDAMKRSLEGTKKVTRATQDATDATVSSHRKFIMSLTAVYAVLKLAPQVAAQFGNALREAAAGRVVRESFNTLAENVDVNATKLVASMKRASRGTIQEIELMRVANRAMLAGGREFAEAMPRLLEISRAAALATGKDFRFVYDTLVSGIARSSIKLIDNAEIYLRVGQVVDDYAESVGKSADELNAAEKQIVILNEVLRQGEDMLRSVGGEVEIATDQFDKWDAQVADAKQNLLDFTQNALGPLGPLIKVTGDAFVDLGPALQTIALLKVAGVFGAIGAGLSAIAGAVTGALLPVIAGAAVGVAVYEKEIRKAIPGTRSYADSLGYLAKGFKASVIAITDSTDAAKNWIATQELGYDPAVRAAEAQFEHRAGLQEFVSELGRGNAAYKAYIVQLNQINTELLIGEPAMKAMTRAQFDFNQAILAGNTPLSHQLRLLQALTEEYAKRNVLLKITSAIEQVIVGTELIVADTIRQSTEAAEEAVKIEEKRGDAAKKIEKILDKMSKLLAKRRADEIKTNRAIEADMTKHNRRLRDLLLDAARDRVDAQRKFEKDIRDAQLERTRDIEEARRRHAMRVEDIEYDHRRRIMEIEERFRRSVRDAAIERDAIGIIQARERRQRELVDATRDRQDALRTESRSYAESIRRAEQSYQDRVRKAQEALAEELRSIEESLQRRLAKERENWTIRLREIQERNQREIDENKLKYAKLEADLLRHVNRINRIQRGLRRTGGTPRMPDPHEPDIPVREGFAGIVQGPQTFRVEPGVTEAVVASGNLRGGQAMPPSSASTQAGAMRAMVSGAVGVGLSGFSDGLMRRVGPQLQQSIGQAVIDEFANALTGA